MVGPTLMACGTPEQQRRFLPAIRQGEHLWCQLFSEPDAGSDLASLRTRAVRDGDGWIVTGQKVWTSGAATADWAILLARTDSGSARHQGITYFLCDMRSRGVEVRPIVQINRAADFNEVHLDEVRIPADCVVGEVGEGWSVARVTLGAERAMIGSMNVGDHVAALVDAARASGRSDDPTLRQDLADVYIRGTVLRYLGDRVLTAVRTGGPVGPEASTIKLGLSGFMGRLGDVATRVLDADGLLEGGAPGATGDATYGRLQDMFLGQWSSRIGGGTEQIQRNLIGERALGLPRDPRPTS
jgi:alkylation response protein AidB-like acyl-CoA dehydrogenase